MFVKVVLAIFAIPVILFISFISFMIYLDLGETKEVYYPTYDNIGPGGERTWIPSFIPRSAGEIRERHNVSTNAQLFTASIERYDDLSLERYDDLSLEGKCEKIAEKEVELPPLGFLVWVGRPFSKFFHVNWWPESLTRGYSKKEGMAQYEFYKCERQVRPPFRRQSFLAVRQIDGRLQVFYWSFGR
jgi:hypothetical protein